MARGSKASEVLRELASEARLLALEAQDLLRLHGAGRDLDEMELEAHLQEVRRVREALYTLAARHKAALEDNSAEELRRLFL